VSDCRFEKETERDQNSIETRREERRKRAVEEAVGEI